MIAYPGWHYNEMKQVGTDYNDAREVTVYDSRMQKLRDIKEENENIRKCIALGENQILIEFGTGTGEFAIEAARHCSTVFAVDISPVMLEKAGQKARDQGIRNIEFHNAGFLTYEHRGAPVDAVVSQLALHHLPDFWKMVALRRVFNMLKPEGRFYLKDTVYTFEIDGYVDFFNNWIEDIKSTADDDFARDACTAIREEYSTFGWIMEELLKKSGFFIDKTEYYEGFMAVYICTKKDETRVLK